MKNINKFLSIVALIALLAGCSNDDDEALNNPFVRFNFNKDYLTVSFDAEASESITEYSWDFGDGGKSTDATPTHKYDDFGSYTVTLSINDGLTSVVREVTLDAPSVKEIESLSIGGEGAAEISAFDAAGKRLFVVNNDGVARINVLNFEKPDSIYVEEDETIMISAFGDGVNSVAVGAGHLAAAIESANSTDPGKVVVWKLDDLDNTVAEVTVGALPDMVTFTGDGKFILCANEGEPNDDYTVDPMGSISLISTSGFGVTTLDFTGFDGMEAELESKGFRVFGPGASLSQDVEPEYIAVSADSKKAYVSLQENNGVAIVDIAGATINAIVPLGLKDYSLPGNEIDPSDKQVDEDEDPVIEFRSVDVFGMYQPDALASYQVDGVNYIVTANEGDSREYEGDPGFVGETRLEDVTLDPIAFSDAASLQKEDNLGRLKMSNSNGDLDGDGDIDQIWSYGARSFSVWNGETGELVWDSGNELEVQANALGVYDDGRSDDKGVEPEGVTIGVVEGRTYAFIGLERVDAVAVYDVSVPAAPVFIRMLKAGDAPEGLVFISAADSPNGVPLLVVSSEDDGTVKVYEMAL